eukprot:scaffold72381_cov77-Phaeocystis_antarctica.AAC.7
MHSGVFSEQGATIPGGGPRRTHQSAVARTGSMRSGSGCGGQERSWGVRYLWQKSTASRLTVEK